MLTLCLAYLWGHMDTSNSWNLIVMVPVVDGVVIIQLQSIALDKMSSVLFKKSEQFALLG